MVSQDEIQHPIQAHRLPTVVLPFVRLRSQHAVLVVLPHEEDNHTIRAALGDPGSAGIVTEVVQLHPVQADRLHF